MTRWTAAVMVLCAGCAEPVLADAVVAPAPVVESPAAALPALPAPSAEAEHFEGQVRRWQDRAGAVTVLVTTPAARGSGVVLSRDGAIVTAAHVVSAQDEGAIVVTFPDGTQAPATVERRQDARDLVLLRVDRTLPTCAPTAADAAGWLLCSGAVGVEHEETEASIGAVVSSGPRWIDTSCPVGRGMSGGPALDADGHVVGVAVSFTGPTSRFARLTPSASLLRGIRCEAEPLAVALPAETDRAAALHALATPAQLAPSIVLVRFETPPYGPGPRAIPGVVVAPGVVLTVAMPELAWDETGAPRTPLSIESEPTARAVRGVTRGELAEIHFEGLSAPPVGRARPLVASGSIVAVASSPAVGIVARADATPGRVEPYLGLPYSRCGHRAMYVRQAHPIVTLPHAFAHDAAAHRGDLLVDAAGAPLGIHVTEQGGIGFAVPLADALASF